MVYFIFVSWAKSSKPGMLLMHTAHVPLMSYLSCAQRHVWLVAAILDCVTLRYRANASPPPPVTLVNKINK